MRPAGALVLSAALLTACATGRPMAVASHGYLSAAGLDQVARAAPPPPVQGSAEETADRAASDRLTALEDTDRWWLAIAQAELRPPEAAQHFDCALGTRLSARPRPALTRLMNRLLADSGTLTARLAEQAARPRPVAVEPGRRACQRLTDAQRASSGRPAGAAVAGAAYGEMFAALAPDRAAAVRRIGHEIGVSRAVCAMAWPSDVAAGETLGRTLYAREAALPAFQLDLEAARAEVMRARAEGLTNPGCASERLALSQPTF